MATDLTRMTAAGLTLAKLPAVVDVVLSFQIAVYYSLILSVASDRQTPGRIVSESVSAVQ